MNEKYNPDRDTCLNMLQEYGTPGHVVRHCKAVTDTALRIAEALNKNGYNLNLELLQGAALLHDIARVEDDHGLIGSQIAEERGYVEAAKLIKCHMFYIIDPHKEKIDEQDILCLADRMVMEDNYVGLDIRMQYVLDKFKGDPAAADRIRSRLEENRIIKKRIEEIIGMDIDELMK